MADRYVNPDYFYEGQEVFIPARWYVKDADQTAGLRCVVAAAHGDHARVVNTRYGVDRLVSKWVCYVKTERA